MIKKFPRKYRPANLSKMVLDISLYFRVTYAKGAFVASRKI